MKPTISEAEMQSETWAKAREMCARYGYDIHEIAADLAHFRAMNAPAKTRALAARADINRKPLPQPATLAHFNDVKKYWDAKRQLWTKSGYVYIGRAMKNPYFNLPQSPFGNPFKIEKDTDDQREDAIELYAEWITQPAQAHLLRRLDSLRGMTLVCFCKPRRCHGDVLIHLMRSQLGESAAEAATPAAVDTPPDHQLTFS